MSGDDVVQQVQQQLHSLRQKAPDDLSRLPRYSEVRIKLRGRRHWLGIWKEQKAGGTALIVVQGRDPFEESTEASCVMGFYLDRDAGYPLAQQQDLSAYA